MFGFELPEIILIVLVGGLIFGVDKIGSLAKSLGRFKGEFTKGQLEIEDEMKKLRSMVTFEEEEKI
ncbi:MAG: twin-arginine translocase TatA/TatE family subunit [bacterium]|nr:twin-arginine translocase TatA/TatE family subunit [bacterium]